MLRIIISKRKLRRAVDRNRARRRVRAVLDGLRPGWRQTFEGAIYPDNQALTLPSPELKNYVVILLQKAKIL